MSIEDLFFSVFLNVALQGNIKNKIAGGTSIGEDLCRVYWTHAEMKFMVQNRGKSRAA